MSLILSILHVIVVIVGCLVWGLKAIWYKVSGKTPPVVYPACPDYEPSVECPRCGGDGFLDEWQLTDEERRTFGAPPETPNEGKSL